MNIRSRLVFAATVAAIGSLALAAYSVAPPTRGGAKELVETLDRFVQPRFLKLDGRFGGSRLARLDTHAAVMLVAESDEEKALLKQAHEMRHAYDISLLHLPHTAGTRPANSRSIIPASKETRPVYLIGIESRGGYFGDKAGEGAYDPSWNDEEKRVWAQKRTKRMRERTDRLTSIGEEAVPALKQGKSVEKRESGWYISMRPIRATEESCVNCHAGSKTGETLGAMVYCVREAKDAEKAALAVARTRGRQ
jgi:hypothetical protein